MLANADRMDLTRFNVKVSKSKLFKIGEPTNIEKMGTGLQNLDKAVRDSRLLADTRAELGTEIKRIKEPKETKPYDYEKKVKEEGRTYTKAKDEGTKE